MIVAGDQGAALGEDGRVGEAPAGLAVFSHTVLLARVPGGSARAIDGVRSTMDVMATVRDLFDVRDGAGSTHAGEGAGARSLFATDGAGLPGGAIVTVASARDELGLRFGALYAMPRTARPSVLVEPFGGATDLSATRPVARAFAERVLREYAASERKTHTSHTRVLPAAVEARLRAIGALR